MKLFHLLVAIVLLSFATKGTSQTIKPPIFDSLSKVQVVPDCLLSQDEQPDYHSIFWRVVQLKEKAIPYLIDALNDTTITQAKIKFFEGFYTVGDIAHKALIELIPEYPVYKLLGINVESDTYISYWTRWHYDLKFREFLRIKTSDWYAENKKRLKWIEKISITDCNYTNPNQGYFKLIK